ncbi:MAG: TfoX/Sxy family protein [Verrucomicrobia bacterium]|nr:TfoX/Sxy family protein [Verrucomicrobiota bacterium]
MPRPPERILPFRPSPGEAAAPLTTLLNLGPKSSAWLAAAKIATRADLERIGTIEACRRVRAAGHPASVLLANALEGALMGCHWNAIPVEFKQQLRTDFDRMKRTRRETTARPPTVAAPKRKK